MNIEPFLYQRFQLLRPGEDSSPFVEIELLNLLYATNVRNSLKTPISHNQDWHGK